MFLYNYSLHFVQPDTRPSTRASSISPPKELIGLWWEDLDPRRHIIADRNNEKLSRHLSQFIVLLYGLPCFSAIKDAILL